MSYSTVVDVKLELNNVCATFEVLDFSYSIFPPATVGSMGTIFNSTNQTAYLSWWYYVNINAINLTSIAPKDSEIITYNAQIDL